MESRVHRLEAAAGADAGLVEQLADLINGVYAVAEKGLWGDGFQRTTTAELATLIAARQIAVATRDGDIAGAIHIEDIEDDPTIFGMLAAASAHRREGVGRALVDYAERDSAQRGRRTMRLELLVPVGWNHPSKEVLKGWDGPRGHEGGPTGPQDDPFPPPPGVLPLPGGPPLLREA